MELIRAMLIVVIFISSIIINIMLYLYNLELKNSIDIKNNSLKSWLDEEVKMKRIYYNLSDAVIEDRNKLRNDLSIVRKRFNKINKLLKSYISWRINYDILKTKFR